MFKAKKDGSSHIKNDRPVFMWKKVDHSKEVQFWCGLTFVQVCRMPPADYEPKHECMGTKIGRHRPITTL